MSVILSRPQCVNFLWPIVFSTKYSFEWTKWKFVQNYHNRYWYLHFHQLLIHSNIRYLNKSLTIIMNQTYKTTYPKLLDYLLRSDEFDSDVIKKILSILSMFIELIFHIKILKLHLKMSRYAYEKYVIWFSLQSCCPPAHSNNYSYLPKCMHIVCAWLWLGTNRF